MNVQQVSYSGDDRLGSRSVWCMHCRERLDKSATSADHVPSKGLLDKPYPPQLPTVTVHATCNNAFSKDELYLATFVGCVLVGSADVDEQTDPRIARRLRLNPSLGAEIARARWIGPKSPGTTGVSWCIDTQRAEPVIVKNARGHVLFECVDPVFDEPASVWFGALVSMADDERREFEDGNVGTEHQLLSEVGSRGLVRQLTHADLVQGWVVVQGGVYRYSVIETETDVWVRTIIREYLATEVIWAR